MCERASSLQLRIPLARLAQRVRRPHQRRSRFWDRFYCVEVDSFLSRDTKETWIIARDPATGSKLWDEHVPGTTISHPPLLDRATDRLRVVLDNGATLCADGATGRRIWQHQLPRPPAPPPALPCGPHTSCVSQAEGILAVADRMSVLHLLDAADGTPLRRVAVLGAATPPGSWDPAERLVRPPWIKDGLLFVATEAAVAAYPFEPTASGVR